MVSSCLYCILRELIYGEYRLCDDWNESLQESEAIADAWQGSQLIVTEGLGHKRILRDK